jgi:hypothetical protein
VPIDLDKFAENLSSLAEGSGIDLLEVKGDDLLICSLTLPRFSLGNNR